MKISNILKLLSAVALTLGQQALAATFNYTNTTSNTTPGTSWSAGTDWNATPVSATDTTLSFTGTLAAGATIFSNNDNSGNFQLNQMSFTNAGPASGTAPLTTISGNPLEFVSNGATTPVITFNTSGTVKPNVTITNALVLTNNLSVSAITSGSLTGIISGTGDLKKAGNGGGTVTLGSANTYTGKTIIQNGAVTVTKLNSVSGGTASSSLGAPTLESTGTIDFGENANSGRLNYNGAGEITDRVINLAGTTGGARIESNTSTNPLIFTSNVTATGSGTKTLILSGGALASPLNQMQGTIGDSAGGVTNLQKINAGNWALANTANTFTGTIVITQGVLAVSTLSDAGTASSIGKGSGAITISDSGGTSNSGTLRIIGAGGSTSRNIITYNSSTIDASGSGAAVFNGTVTGTNNAQPAALLTLRGTSGSTLTNKIEGNISGASMALTKADANIWQISGANSFGGVTTVSTGTLIVGSNAPSGSNGVLGNATSEVVLGTAGGSTHANLLIGGAFAIGRDIRIPTNDTTDSGTRVLTLGGNTAANSIFSGNITLGTDARAGRGVTLTAASSGQVTFSGVIQNPAGMDATNYTVTKSGLGTVVLSNTNTYTGATKVSEGTLQLDGSLATTSVSVESGGILTGTGTISGSVTAKSGGHLAFSVAANQTLQDPLNITGLLDVKTGSIIDLSAAATPANGDYILAVSTVPITYSPGTENLGSITGSISLSVDQLSLVLTVTGGSSSAYGTWANTTYGLNGGNADFDYDYDNDGLDNGLEWVLGGNPTTSTPSVSPVPTRDGSNNLILTFTREEDAIAETVLTLEYGTNLTDWTPFAIDADGGTDANGVVVAIDQVANPDAVTVTIPGSQAPSGKIFSRLKAVKIP